MLKIFTILVVLIVSVPCFAGIFDIIPMDKMGHGLGGMYISRTMDQMGYPVFDRLLVTGIISCIKESYDVTQGYVWDNSDIAATLIGVILDDGLSTLFRFDPKTNSVGLVVVSF